jgi:hypothetical protein
MTLGASTRIDAGDASLGTALIQANSGLAVGLGTFRNAVIQATSGLDVGGLGTALMQATSALDVGGLGTFRNAVIQATSGLDVGGLGTALMQATNGLDVGGLGTALMQATKALDVGGLGTALMQVNRALADGDVDSLGALGTAVVEFRPGHPLADELQLAALACACAYVVGLILVFAAYDSELRQALADWIGIVGGTVALFEFFVRVFRANRA